MIQLTDVRKVYPTRHGKVEVLRGVNLELARGEKIGILGRNGAGKSTLSRVIGGIERPTSGQVVHDMSISWPLAFTGGFQPSLTGYDNIRFICRVYDAPYEEAVSFVLDFSELGAYLGEPVRIYSSGMRARLAFALSMIVEFDCYLIDEIVAVGDARFLRKCQEELFEKRADRAMIIVTHDTNYLREHCDWGCVLFDGILHKFDKVDEAIDVHLERMSA
jgi:capsular polysaccharide transport system ATP-binding protein